MKINRPNNWIWHQAFDGSVPHPDTRGTGYTLTNGMDADEALDRVRRLRATVTEVTGMPTQPTKPAARF